MGDYTISRYTSLFTTKRNNTDEFLIYSSITNCFINVSEDVFQKINLARKNGNINKSLFSKNTSEFLKEAKIIVAPTADDAFVRQCEIDTYISNYASSHMSLSLHQHHHVILYVHIAMKNPNQIILCQTVL